MDRVAPDDATRGYLGAMRQCSSYSAQLGFGIIVAIFQFILPDPRASRGEDRIATARRLSPRRLLTKPRHPIPRLWQRRGA